MILFDSKKMRERGRKRGREGGREGGREEEREGGRERAILKQDRVLLRFK